MKLIEYLPEFLQEIKEFKALFESENIEIENLRGRLDEIINESLVNTAKGYGLERYEKIYNIKNMQSTIDTRRILILLRMNNRTQYTYKWLINVLNETIGNRNYKLLLDYNNYKLYIDISLDHTEAMKLLKKDLVKQIPANIEIEYTLFSNMEITTECLMRQKSYDTYYAN